MLIQAVCLALSAGLLVVKPPVASANLAPAPYDARIGADIEATIARYQLPGIAVAVIRGGHLVHLHTAGERIAGSGEAISTDTLFKIASNSKSMTASLLARLVQAGKLRWDDPVVKHLPGFRLHDAWVTREMQVRDLLVHNSGLPEGGGDLMLWPEPNDFSRADILAGLSHIPLAYSFRSGYAYDNTLYIVAGELAAAVGGASYETLMQREVFVPLGLQCRVGAFNLADAGSVAQPHRRIGAGYVPTDADREQITSISSAAAGGVRCSLDAMLLWARNWLDPNAAQLAWLGSAQRAEMLRPRTPMPVSDQRRRWNGTHALFYGFGFRLADMDGAWTVSHTGTLSGMYSALTLLPDQHSGFVFMINGDAEQARTVLSEVLLKHLTSPSRVPTVAALANELQSANVGTVASRAPDLSGASVVPPMSVASWPGLWRDPWFGQVTICEHEGAMRFSSDKSPLLRGRVMALGDRQFVDWDDDGVEPAWLRFAAAKSGAPPTLHMAKVDPDADFSFDYEDLAFQRMGECDAESPASSAVEAGLVDAAILVPGMAIDMRYAGRDNFTGAPVDGYLAAKCLLRPDVARALARVEQALRQEQMRLQVFDCYRPTRAVRSFVHWAALPDDPGRKAVHYPNVAKPALLGDYIAPVSGHSRGATVDLGLLDCRSGTCVPLDMGTNFDFFDPVANTESSAVTDAQRGNRHRLLEAMAAQGFSNYPMEWWHYTLDPAGTPRIRYDIPVE